MKKGRLQVLLVLFKMVMYGAPGWLTQFSVRLRLRSWSYGLVREFKPHIGVCADSSEPGACLKFCVSLSLCPSPALSLSLKKINIKKIYQMVIYEQNTDTVQYYATGKFHCRTEPMSL